MHRGEHGVDVDAKGNRVPVGDVEKVGERVRGLDEIACVNRDR